MKIFLTLLLFACLLVPMPAAAGAQPSGDEKALLDPQPSTAEQDSLIKVGTRLHDQGNYGSAVLIYESVLKENPSNIVALYEISYSLLSKHDFDGAIRYADEGIKYRSRFHSMFYMTKANALDNSGHADEAIATYREGIQMDPKNYLFPYNLGVTCLRRKMLDSARSCFQEALELNPYHPGSNFGLSNTYEAMRKPVPRLFALSRFLVLEPSGGRSAGAARQLQETLLEAITRDKTKPENITITVTPDSDAVDGYMTVLGLSLSMAQTKELVDTTHERTELQRTVEVFKSLFQIMLELNEKESYPGFCWTYYAPYYIEMQRQGHTEAFVYYIFRSSGDEEVNTWLRENGGKLKDFLAWNKSYKW